MRARLACWLLSWLAGPPACALPSLALWLGTDLGRTVAFPQANITGLDIFTGQKKQDIAPTSHNMEAPFVHVTNLQLVDITDEGFCSLMDEAGETRDDLRLPDDNSPDKELGQRIRKAFEGNKEVTCIITRAMEQEVVRWIPHSRVARPSRVVLTQQSRPRSQTFARLRVSFCFSSFAEPEPGWTSAPLGLLRSAVVR